MNIDEAIKHCEEIAGNRCDACGAEHNQLAKWLKELKSQRQEIEQLSKLHQMAEENCERLVSDKNEQAGRIMRYDTALKECVGLIKDSRDILKDLGGLFVEIHKTTACTATLALIIIIDNTVKTANALLGGKEDV